MVKIADNVKIEVLKTAVGSVVQKSAELGSRPRQPRNNPSHHEQDISLEIHFGRRKSSRLASGRFFKTASSKVWTSRAARRYRCKWTFPRLIRRVGDSLGSSGWTFSQARDRIGLSSRRFNTIPPDRILVQLPGIEESQRNEGRATIEKTAYLEFRLVR